MGAMEVGTQAEQKSLLATLAPGKRTRLRRLLFEFGPGHGTLLFLPIDQGIEHGPRDFFPNPASKDPEYQFRLAAEAGYSAIACEIGLATKYYPDFAGQVPLILKLNGKTDVPPSGEALSTCNATVEDAVRLGADAVGYTLYVGSPRQDEDLVQLGGVRRDCDRFGMPLIVWAYPRGSAIEKKGGRDSFYAIDYGARMAMEMGADVVKLNMPKIDPEKDKDSPAPYNEGNFTQEEAIRHCVASAGRSLVVLSGGSKVDDEKLLGQTRFVLEAGGSGVIYGRNVWQREWSAALEIIEQIKEIMLSSVSRDPVALRAAGSLRRTLCACAASAADVRRPTADPAQAGAPDAEGLRGCERRAAIVVLALAVATGCGSEEDGDEALGHAASARVLRVIDGDTIEVSIEGSEEDVRYIGVDTPETVKPGAPVECYGPQASAANHRLVEGRTVRLVFDRERRDAYGRLLAYVYARGRSRGGRSARGGGEAPVRQRGPRPRGLRANPGDRAQHRPRPGAPPPRGTRRPRRPGPVGRLLAAMPWLTQRSPSANGLVAISTCIVPDRPCGEPVW